MCKKMTITSIILLLMCITVSFAWMLDVVGPVASDVFFRFEDSLYVAPNELEIDIQIEENNEFVPLYAYANGVENENVLAKFDNQKPGDLLKFSMTIKNTSDLELNVSILFSEIVASHQDFYNYIDFGIISSKGFDNYLDAPTISDFILRDRIEGYNEETYDFSPDKAISISFLKNLKVPANDEGINIKFYIRLNINAGNSLQNQTFTIGKINFLCV